MKKQLIWFVIGVIVGTIGMTTLSASRGSEGGGWTDQDVSRVVYLLEQIKDNTTK